MTTLYIVTGNWCNDIWVVGVYSTKPNAVEAIKAEIPVNAGNPSSTYYDIEEHTLDSTKERF